MGDKRLEQLNDWLCSIYGEELANLSPASSDASFRRYFRFIDLGKSYIVMDAPPDREDCRPFIEVSQQLLAQGVNVPEVLASNLEQGYLLLTDLGKQTYLQVLNDQNADSLYQDAISSLIRIQRGGLQNHGIFPVYGEKLLLSEMQLFVDWLLDRHLQISLDTRQAHDWRACKQWLLEQIAIQPVTWVHRDYHSRNLMICADHNPGVLDFQDAVEGPITYDLVSLLKDCYVCWPRQRILTWLSLYHHKACVAALPVPELSRFTAWFDLMGVQRHLKAAGIFARLYHRDQKSGYLADIPRVLAYIHEVAKEHTQLVVLEKLSQQALDRMK